jgi:tetratricopeptide (TPR) repeat protein
VAEYDAPYAEAEQLRINGNEPDDFRRAIRLYQQYIEQGGPNVRAANHMAGVCYQLLHEYDEATEFYLKALEGASDYERGNIERDMAESYGALAEYESAEISLATSLGLLPYEQYPDEHEASLGFLARLQLRQGQIDEALETFADADRKLQAGGNRHTELYNKLECARTLFLAGRKDEARDVAFACLRLSTGLDPATGLRYGTRRHNLRALALLDEHGTEETLAASLGLVETPKMAALRQKLLRISPRGVDEPSAEFNEELSRYHQLGQAAVDAKGDEGGARAKAQIALILLMASVRRDLASFNASFADDWSEDLTDARTYARNLDEDGIVDAITALLVGNAAGPHTI